MSLLFILSNSFTWYYLLHVTNIWNGTLENEIAKDLFPPNISLNILPTTKPWTAMWLIVHLLSRPGRWQAYPAECEEPHAPGTGWNTCTASHRTHTRSSQFLKKIKTGKNNNKTLIYLYTVPLRAKYFIWYQLLRSHLFCSTEDPETESLHYSQWSYEMIMWVKYSKYSIHIVGH